MGGEVMARLSTDLPAARADTEGDPVTVPNNSDGPLSFRDSRTHEAPFALTLAGGGGRVRRPKCN